MIIAARALGVIKDMHTVSNFNGSHGHPSPYKGPPNDRVDLEWDEHYNCNISPKTLDPQVFLLY